MCLLAPIESNTYAMVIHASHNGSIADGVICRIRLTEALFAWEVGMGLLRDMGKVFWDAVKETPGQYFMPLTWLFRAAKRLGRG